MSDSFSERLSKLSPAQRELLQRRLSQKSPSTAETSVPTSDSSPAGRQKTGVNRNSASAEPIAVIGAACRFPGANDLAQFWQLIDQGRDATGEIPPSRWDVDKLYDPTGTEPGKTSIRHGGFVDNVDRFDATFFGIAPREAARMDPQQRLLLETVYHAIQNAGIAPKSMAGSRTGVYVGIGGTDYSKIPAHFPDYLEQIDAHVGTGNALSVAAGRISYIFDFHGPSFIVDTACSSALVALHSGVQSLRLGEADAAIIAGVNLILTPEVTIAFSKANMLSRDGQCRPFDASASGYVRGEGCGVVLLKRLSDAQRDGDPIMGVIRGTAVNQDGRTSGITAPNGPSQQDCIDSAMAVANVTPEQISYVEAHGTATPLGDPIELGSLASVFVRKSTEQQPVYVTSVKANIGHTETVSGMAGLIKVLLMMKHGRIPSQLHLNQLNPNAKLSGSRIEIPTTPLDWDGGGSRIAGISSFGFGGTNSHVILQSPESYVASEACDETRTSDDSIANVRSGAKPWMVLPLSARSDEALADMAKRYAALVDATPDQAHDICQATSLTRDAHPKRVAVVAGDGASLSAGLAAAAAESNGEASTPDARFHVVRRIAVSPRPTIAMLFTGQGSQYPQMGAALYRTNETFRRSFDAACEIVDQTRREAGEADLRSLKSIVMDNRDDSINLTGFAQPAIVAFECAVVDYLTHIGVKPSMVCGHSVGEYAAAYAAGVMTHQQTLELITHRGRLMQALPDGGAMTAVFASADEVVNLFNELPVKGESLSIAAINGPRSIVVSGPVAALEPFQAAADAAGIVWKKLAVSHAFHSPLMKPMLVPFRQFADAIKYSPPRCPIVGGLLGARLSNTSVDNDGVSWPDYFSDAILQTVRFDDCVDEMLSMKPAPNAFVEVGPSPHLIGLMQRSLRDERHESHRPKLEAIEWIKLAGPTNDQPADSFSLASMQLGTAIASLYAVGAELDWALIHGISETDRRKLRTISLPLYDFDRTRHWMESSLTAGSVRRDEIHPLLGGPVDTILSDDLFEAYLSANRPSLIAEHVVGGTVVMPAAGLIEIAIAAARQRWPQGTDGNRSFSIEDFSVTQPLTFSNDKAKRVQTRIIGGSSTAATWQIYSRRESARSSGSTDDQHGSSTWILHAQGRFRVHTSGRTKPENVKDSIAQTLSDSVQTHDRQSFYDLLADRELEYGPRFQVIDFVHRAPAAAVAEIVTGEAVATTLNRVADPFTIHPGLLDGAMQLMAAITPMQSDGTYSRATYMPIAVDQIQWQFAADSGSDSDSGQTSIEKMWIVRTHPAEPTVDEREIRGDIALVDADGTAVMTLRGVRVRRLQASDADDRSTADNTHYRLTWISKNSDAVAATPVASEPFIFVADVDSDLDIVSRTHSQTRHWMRTLQQLVRQTPVHKPVWMVTQNAVAVDDEPSLDAASAALWGMGRVAQNEHPELDLRLLDVDDVDEARAWIASGAAGIDDENQLSRRQARLRVLRLVRGDVDETDEATKSLSLPLHRRFQVRLGGSNRLSDLKAVPFAAAEPEPDQVVVAVAATGVNFSDVLKAMGLYPGITDDIVPLGIECSGIIRQVGENVADFEIGDRVFGVVPYGFASEVAVPAYTMAKLPDHIAMDEAATLPIAMMTAHYALRRLADLQPGERVLIHAGAGGVGMAAIQIAQRVGAEIYTTAGSESKRDLLRQLGVRHVYDSRSLDFADQIREQLQSLSPQPVAGIDVVLNSLPGEAIDRSLELLGPYGRFVEIGKTEIYQNRMIGLSPFQDNLSYHAIDLDRVLRQRPDTVRSLWNEILSEISAGHYRPLPMTKFDVADVDDALRFMAARRNIGKVIVHVADETEMKDAEDPQGDATCLITGGTGAIGLRLAEHLAAAGVRSIALLARREPDEIVRQQIERIRHRGADVIVLQGDVADAASLADAINAMPRNAPPIRQVMHAAGALADGLLFDMTDQQLDTVLSAKVDGTTNLLKVFDVSNLDTFVMFSSIASLLGSPGQANYAAANAFLDATAANLRSQGIPATSINFGPWAGGGMAERDDTQSGLDSRGISAIPADIALEHLDRSIQSHLSNTIVMVADWQKLGGGRDVGSLPSPIRDLVAQASGDRQRTNDHSLRDAVAAMGPDERVEYLVDDFAGQLSLIMGLDVDQINVDDSLAAVGLDSLMAIELKSTIEKRLQVVLPMARFMEGPSLKELAKEVNTMIVDAPEVTMIRGDLNADASTGKTFEHALSGGQQSLWFLNRLAPESAAYNIADAVVVHGQLDSNAVVRAVDILTDRHESFRTIFPNDGGKPTAKVMPASDVKVRFVDAQAFSDQQVQTTIHELVHRPFDLAAGPLLRIEVLRRSDDTHLLVFGVHHIIADFWSLVTLMSQFTSLYQDLVAGRSIDAAPAPHQYRHFVDFQQRLLESHEGHSQRDYWTAALSGELPVLDLPIDHPRPALQTFEGRLAFRSFGCKRTAQLNELAKQASMTVNSLLLAAYQLLLHRLSGQDDVLIGLPTSGRSRNELAEVIGYFVNPVVVRSRLSPAETLKEFLQASAQTTVAAMANQDYPLARVVDQLKIDRDPSRSALFQAMFVMQKAQAMHEQGLTAFLMGKPGATMPVGDLKFESMALEHYVAQFDLSLAASQDDDDVSLALQYNTALFDDSTAQSMLDRLTRIIDSMIQALRSDGDDAPLADVEWISHDERSVIINDWGNGPEIDDDPPLVHQAFEQQVLRTPDANAVADQETRWSYRELNERANRIAHRLMTDGMVPGQLVGICMPRCNDLLAAMLGVLKAGGCYVPLDPRYPAARMRRIQSQTSMFGVLVDETTTELCRDAETSRLYQAADLISVPETFENPCVKIDQSSPCYIIFTSGSTGQPKGAVVQHLGFGGLVRWYVHELQLDASDSALVVTSHGFDLTQKNFFAPLTVGGRVVMSDPGVFDPHLIADEVHLHGVTLINATPSTVYPLSSVAQSDRLTSLRAMVLGGESIDRHRLGELVDRVAIYNSYGPTECSDVVAAYRLSPLDRNVVPLGRPINNVRLYVLDSDRRVVPAGVTGELFIGGSCVGGGYINDDAMTQAKFVPDPFSGYAGARMYASGDLARWTHTGNLEFLGRRDDQIKIRGHRIELGEVESAIVDLDEVAEVCVLLREDEQVQRLIAYIVSVQGVPKNIALAADQMLSRIREVLPSQAVPSAIVFLDRLPLSPHGKVDRSQLPAPEFSNATGRAQERPRTPVEISLVDIWASVLRLEPNGIGRRDNFFALGGDSLLAIQLVNRMDDAGYRVSPALLMQKQTIAALADAVEVSSRVIDHGTTIPIETSAPATPLQQRLLDQQLINVHHRHLSVTVAMPGHLDRDRILRGVSELAKRHLALRMKMDSEGRQVLGEPPLSDSLATFADLSNLSHDQASHHHASNVQQVARSIRIDEGKPIRFVVAQMPEDVTWLTLIGHFLFLDPVSMQRLIEELAVAYENSSTDQPLRVETIDARAGGTIQYANRLIEFTQSGGFDDVVDDWVAMTKSDSASPPFPTSTYAEAATETLTFDGGDGQRPWEGVARIAQALADGWQRVTGEHGIDIEIETTGRNVTSASNGLSPVSAGMIGRLVSLFPIHVISGQPADALRRQLTDIPDDGVSFGYLKRFGPDDVQKHFQTLAVPRVRLNYLGRIADQPIPIVHHPGLDSSINDLRNQRMHTIEIDVSLQQGIATMVWTFPSDASSTKLVQRWIGFVGKRLKTNMLASKTI